MQFLISGSEVLKNQSGFKLVGREDDLKRLSSALMRTKAASVILVGPGGVGVTALCMGLQASKDDPNVSFDIVAKRIFWLKTDELFALGNTEAITNGFSGIVAILKRTPDSILVIEDTRDFIEASRNAGCNHFINSLNSLVKNGESQIIFEAKDQDLDMIFAIHSDMRQCYTLIDISEPTGENLLKIVSTNAASLVNHHGIKIDQDAIDTAIDLTNKYRTRDASLSRAQPERSYNLLDRALATYRLDAHKQHPKISALKSQGKSIPPDELAKLESEFQETQSKIKELFALQREGEIAIINLEEQIEAIKKEEEAKPVNTETSEPGTNKVRMFAGFAKAGGFEPPRIQALRDEIRKFQNVIKVNREEFDRLTGEINSQLCLTKEIVLAEFSRLSGIPANKLNEDEREKLKNLETTIKNRVFGQDEVIKKIANAVKVARIGRRNGGKPQASFLIMGPSGSGKTETAKALAHAIKDDEAALTRFDMSEYMEKHSVAKLIGAPAGYEGSERGGILTNAMRANPNRIILFDEIEKADPSVFDLFLQILSDGRLTDNHGRTVNFSDSMIIMTTNIGQSFFLDESISDVESERLANIELDSKYRPEFLNRFAGRQNIVCFRRLGLDSIEKIVRRELNDLNRAYRESGLDIIISDDSLKLFCADHYETRSGARGLQGYVVSNIEPMIADLILENQISGTKLELIYDKETRKFVSKFS